MTVLAIQRADRPRKGKRQSELQICASPQSQRRLAPPNEVAIRIGGPFKVSPFHAATVLVLAAFDGLSIDRGAGRPRQSGDVLSLPACVCGSTFPQPRERKYSDCLSILRTKGRSAAVQTGQCRLSQCMEMQLSYLDRV
jgi:hypothetical protein